jgi:hypothetical protein
MTRPVSALYIATRPYFAYPQDKIGLAGSTRIFLIPRGSAVESNWSRTALSADGQL